ncbi:MAG TPA: DinB family protein [Thermoanaerobaculia bacterium]|nr:DinB family protein [Thermoanaerobaculia bacterium]
MAAEEIFTQTVLNSWKQTIGQLDKTFASFSDEDLQREVAPGRNRVYYLLGHLTAVHDRLLPLLRFGDRLHPELDETFLANPDRTSPTDGFEPAALRSAWSDVNAKLLAGLEELRPEEWLERHDSVSPEDFAKEPHRNRLAVVLSRSLHASMHEGQIRLAKAK